MKQSPLSNGILIIDLGSQYTQLIARRLRENGFYTEITHAHPSAKNLQTIPKAIIFSGSGQSIDKQNLDLIEPIQSFLALNIPTLGICYGMQIIAHLYGGSVADTGQHEYGRTEIKITKPHPLFSNITDHAFETWMSHADSVTKLPADFNIIAKSSHQLTAAFTHHTKPLYGLQFHPEVQHTQHGSCILTNFAKLSGCQNTWQTQNIINHAVHNIQTTTAGKKVLLALSGGVDSSVVALLLDKAIGQQLTCLFIDNGLLRYQEVEEIQEYFKKIDIHVVCIDAKKQFFDALSGIKDPEQKRKKIGQTFIDIFHNFSTEHAHDFEWLAQGTIYPDIIESAGNQNTHAKVIKSHHNVGGLPEDMPFKILEPIAMLFKDEVRHMGKHLGLDPLILNKQPFPGPGLAVRISGEVTAEKCRILQKADHLFTTGLKEANYYQHTQQAFAVLTNTKSVGVVGDARRWGKVLALRAVETSDFMTASACEIPYKIIKRIASNIVNQVPEISRVTYDISDKPPATIEWE